MDVIVSIRSVLSLYFIKKIDPGSISEPLNKSAGLMTSLFGQTLWCSEPETNLQFLVPLVLKHLKL